MVKKKYSRKKTKRKKYQKKKKKTNLHRNYKRKNKTQRGGVIKRRKINYFGHFVEAGRALDKDVSEEKLNSPYKEIPVEVSVGNDDYTVRNLMSAFDAVGPTPIDQWELDILRRDPNRKTYIYALLFGDKIKIEDSKLELTQKKFRIYVGKTTCEDYLDRIDQHIAGKGAIDTKHKFIYAVKIIACVQFKDTVVVSKRRFALRDYFDQVAENSVRLNLIHTLFSPNSKNQIYDYVVGGNYTTKGSLKPGFDYVTAINFLNLNQEWSGQSEEPFSAHNFIEGCLYQHIGKGFFRLGDVKPIHKYVELPYNYNLVMP